MPSPPPAATAAETDSPETEALRKRAHGSNVNEQTLLATDYLNHFNEVVMLLEMLPDMPEMIEDVKAWRPKSYQDHFRTSTIADRELAVEAYDHVSKRYRESSDKTVDQINRLIASSPVSSASPRTSAGANLNSCAPTPRPSRRSSSA